MEQPQSTVSSLGDLEAYGLNCLTGESCAYGMRLLFDVSDYGREQLEIFFGVKKLELYPNWNGWVGTYKAVGCIMLTADVAWEFAAFMMLLGKYEVVIPCQAGHHGVYGFNLDTDGAEEFYREQAQTLRILRNNLRGETRNTHQMSGRTE